jgi:hypothetical protein
MLFHEQPTDPWRDYDFKLLEAYQRLQDELCPKCGHPVWLCRSSSNRVEFPVRVAYCAAERSLKEHEAGMLSATDKKKITRSERAGWGRFYYTEPKVPENVDGELPTRREYYGEIAQKR